MRLKANLLPLFVVTVLASACASNDPRYTSNGSRVGSRQDPFAGHVEAIESVRGDNSGVLAGTVIGGVVGAVAGHQVGEGRTKDVATVAGAVGGAEIGRKIDKAHSANDDAYAILVRLNDGSRQTITQANLDGLRVGDSVRIDADSVRRN